MSIKLSAFWAETFCQIIWNNRSWILTWSFNWEGWSWKIMKSRRSWEESDVVLAWIYTDIHWFYFSLLPPAESSHSGSEYTRLVYLRNQDRKLFYIYYIYIIYCINIIIFFNPQNTKWHNLNTTTTLLQLGETC